MIDSYHKQTGDGQWLRQSLEILKGEIQVGESKKEVGPIFGVELISTLKLNGGMMQAMPSREDLKRVQGLSTRTVAGYEVLLSKYHTMLQALRLLQGFEHLDDLTMDIITKAIEKAEPVL